MITRAVKLKQIRNTSLNVFINKMIRRSYSVRMDLDLWEMRTAEYLRAGSYRYSSPWRPIRLGETWKGNTVFFRKKISLPEDFTGRNAWFFFDNNGESLVSVNGMPVQGLDANHIRMRLTEKASDSDTYEVLIESTPRWRERALAEYQGAFFPPHVLYRAEAVSIDHTVSSFIHELRSLFERYMADEESDLAPIVCDILAGIHPDDPEDLFLSSLESLGSLLPLKEKSRKHYTIEAIGHSHIDLAYLWPMQETVRKCARTFSTMLALMDEYPDFTFTQSQPYLYKLTKQHYPDLYEKIKRHVGEGRWEVTGGMYVEPDGNIPSGESFVRQILHGVRFVHQEFGKRMSVCWLPDTFGFCATLPQILCKAGLHSFYTTKLMVNDTNEFPHGLFYWEGIDGSRVTAVSGSFNSYSGTMEYEQIKYGIDHYHEKESYPRLLYPFGHGDGGGGVTREMLDSLRCFKASLPSIDIENGTVEKFFERVHREGPELPVWKGELYLEYHRGTYTSQAAVKRLNRACEIILRDAEILSVLASGAVEPIEERLPGLWETLLINQFHDVLAGTSLTEVFETARKELNCVKEQADRLCECCLRYLSGIRSMEGPPENTRPYSLYVLNTLSFQHSEYLCLEIDELMRPSSGMVPVIRDLETDRCLPCVVDAEKKLLVRVSDIPPFGFRKYDISMEVSDGMQDQGTAGKSLSVKEIDDSIHVENRFFRITIDRKGGSIRSIIEREGNREYLEGSGCDVEMIDEVFTSRDAWNIKAESMQRGRPLGGVVSVEVYSRSPIHVSIKVRRSFGRSRMDQRIKIFADSRRIDFDTEVEWNENGKLLKAAVCTAIEAEYATYDIPFGTIERSTHPETTWDKAKHEVSAHKWADYSDGAYGVAVLNQGKYGYDITGQRIRLSLLKSSGFPDTTCDRGTHRFLYSIFPHPGDWKEGEVDREALQLNFRLSALVGQADHENDTNTGSALSLTGKGVYVSALKYADDGSGELILRLSEYHGETRRVVLHINFTDIESVCECNLLEEREAELSFAEQAITLEIKAYEVKTIRIKGRPRQDWYHHVGACS